MQFGFSTVDITPRVGVQLYGYGPYLNRNSISVREPLYARAMVFSDGRATGAVVACDLVGVSGDITDQVRAIVTRAIGIAGDHICVHCIHTHSGPRTKFGLGQGEPDAPYLRILPHRIARACIEAFSNLHPARLSHACVPCVGLGYNREDDERPSLEDALSESWRPALPGRTDTEAHVLRVETHLGLAGFLSYFSCHPVVGPSVGRYIHSDFVGVATNCLARENPGSVGLFLQGCEGNINSCVVHHDEQQSLLALDVLACRYARQVRVGISHTQPLPGDEVRALSRTVRLTRAPLPRCELEAMLEHNLAVLNAPGASDADPNIRLATVYIIALEKELARQDAGERYPVDAEIQGFRIGDLVLVGAPFEIMIGYKQRIQAACPSPTLVLSLCNDTWGYAPERKSFGQEGNYAAQVVPYLLGFPPFAPSIEDELVGALTDLALELWQ